MTSSTELDHAYQVVGEILEYFESAHLATWAPVAALIEREREAAFREGYKRGYFSNGNYFPDESWLRFTNRPVPPKPREPSIEERPY